MDRRLFLAGAATVTGLAAARVPASAQSPLLTVTTRQIEVGRRGATVFGVAGANGRHGILAREGDRFSGALLNATAEPLVMHWHGQIYAPAEQDRARTGGGELAPGQSDLHDFRLTPGTHWMHSHTLTEQQLLAAPMVTREKDAGDVQDVIVMLHDFSFRPPAELLAGLGGVNAHSGHAGHGATPAAPAQAGGQGAHAGHGMQHGGANHSAMGHGAGQPHANDIQYDAFLANDRTLEDPEVVRVERGSKLRLRIINGATATAFFIDTGAVTARCIAVDGSPCQPHPGRRFPLAQGQRIDLVLDIPASGGAFPIFAQVEAERMLTGIILATAGATVRKYSAKSEHVAKHTDLSLDLALRAVHPLPTRAPSRIEHIMLGEGPNYRWTINGAIHGEHKPILAKVGERIEFMFMNPTTMMHPMHIHGHHFQVVGSRSGRFSGPVRDTVIVPPHTPVMVAIDFDKPGSWYLHCHHLYHMATGMMTEVVVS
ncbi:MAG TPA: multicopper oxidase domain-containing protein [Beijerinckiaceae bacterium]|nr:multicopper oxidase domain-containing protein [Beijerinckiaceae bacterium]